MAFVVIKRLLAIRWPQFVASREATPAVQVLPELEVPRFGTMSLDRVSDIRGRGLVTGAQFNPFA
jgi:hypothetical protein